MSHTRHWSGHSMYGQRSLCGGGILCCVPLTAFGLPIPPRHCSAVCQYKGNNVAENHHEDVSPLGELIPPVVHRSCHQTECSGIIQIQQPNSVFVLHPTLPSSDAYRSPHWLSAGRGCRGEDAPLLPFWEQCHISQQV